MKSSRVEVANNFVLSLSLAQKIQAHSDEDDSSSFQTLFMDFAENFTIPEMLVGVYGGHMANYLFWGPWMTQLQFSPQSYHSSGTI